MEQCEHKCLCPVGLGLAFGILWGLSLFIMALIVFFAGGYGVSFVKSVGELYLGYSATVLGAFIGALWGFIDGFAGGVILGWLYNFFCRVFCRCKGNK